MLTLDGLGRAVTAPVHLTVHGWKVGNPGQWKTSVGLFQSPESLAGHYRVRLWSDKHFELVERSLMLMGQAGNDILNVGAVGRSLFGDDPLIAFRRQGASWTPDLRFLRRYLGLYAKHAPEPQFLCLQVWHYGMFYDGHRRDGKKRGYAGPYPWRARTIPIHELRGRGVAPAEMPIYGEPGTEAVWRQTIDEVRKLCGELGWKRTRLLLGTSGDEWPSKTTIDFFRKIDPDVYWRVATHGSSVRNWGMAAAERMQANGMVCDVANIVRRGVWKQAKPTDAVVSVIGRGVIGSGVFDYLGIAPLAAVAANYDGFCMIGVDCWGYTDPDGAHHRVVGEYTTFGNVLPGRPSVLGAPGRNGPVATVQHEMLREGLQLAEALLFLREKLTDARARPRMGAELAGRARDVIQTTCDVLESGRRMHPHGGGNLWRQVTRVYETASAVAAATF